MTYSLHPGAELDIADALDFYGEHAGTSGWTPILRFQSASP